MANPKSISSLGNQLIVTMTDDARFIAYPTVGGLWIVGGVDIPPVEGPAIWPFDPATVTSEYRSATRPTHDGIDFAYPGIAGDPIPSSMAGVVDAYSTNHAGYGNYVAILTDYQGTALRLLYAHMQVAPYVNLGEVVTQGQTLGIVGQTGASNGDHLHWETKINGSYVNPRDFMATYG